MQVGKRLKKLKEIKIGNSGKLLIFYLTVVFLSSLFASLVQSDFGSIDIEMISIVDEYGNTITGKLYRPVSATWENPAPGVVICHGMNNDKDTEGPVALELARRGMVALTVDQHNHGDSDIGMDVLGGYLGTSATPENDTLGADAAYDFLQNSLFVDGTKMGIVGHSMGGGTARTLAKINPDHKAVVIQSGGPDNLTDITWMNNYLDIWPYYEELFITPLESREDFITRGKNQIEVNLAIIGETPVGSYYDQNYGDFETGTAQRYALCQCTHPAVTWNAKSIRETVAWLLQALKGYTDPDLAMSEASTQTYLIKEYLTLLGTICLILAILPLVSLLLNHPYFTELVHPLPTTIMNEDKKWWKPATINSAIGGFTFIFLPGLGMLLLGVLSGFLPIWRLLTGNGSLFWLLINALICHFLFKRWRKRSSEANTVSNTDLGFFNKPKTEEDHQYLKKTFLLTVITFVSLYLMVSLIQAYFKVELRFMWPLLKTFTPFRLFQFLVYLGPLYLFFKINGGKLMFGQLRMKEYSSPAKTQFMWWIKYLFAMEAGLLLVLLIQYLPMFLFGTGPAFSGAALSIFFFGLWGIFLMQILPQFALVFFLTTALYRKTGKIYVGAFIATMLVAWIMAVSGQLV